MAVVLLIPLPRQWKRFTNMSRRDSNSKHHKHTDIAALASKIDQITRNVYMLRVSEFNVLSNTMWSGLSVKLFLLNLEHEKMMQWSIKYAKRGKTGRNHSASANQVLDGAVFGENPGLFFFFFFLSIPRFVFPTTMKTYKLKLWQSVTTGKF